MQQLWERLRDSESEGGRFGLTLDEMGPVDRITQMRESGYFDVAEQDRSNPHYEANFNAIRRLYTRCQRGDYRAREVLREAMTISDFSGYFGDVLQRDMLSNYQEAPYQWDLYAKRNMINDMRQQKIFRVDRGGQVLDSLEVPGSSGPLDGGNGTYGMEPLSAYPMRRRVMTNYTDQLYKFGCMFAYAAETLWADDLAALQDTPSLMGRAVRRTEAKRATSLYSNSSGPITTFFSDTTYKNVVTNAGSNFPFVTTNNPVLSATSLQWAITIASMQKDLDGEPIQIEDFTLVVPPVLKWTANNIVRSSQVALNTDGGLVSGNNSTVRLYAPNQMQGIVKVAVDYYAPIVNTTNGNTAWYLFANPASGRPALQLSFMRNRPAPQFLLKSSSQMLIGEGSAMGAGGGALVSPMEGDWDRDEVACKVRHYLGGALLDPVCAVTSTGAAS